MVLNPGCTLGSNEELLKHTDARALPKEVDGIDLERAQPASDFVHPPAIPVFNQG